MQRLISKIVLFNKTNNGSLIISNFEKRGLHFRLLILTILMSDQNYLKRRMTRPNNGFIFFNKIWFFLSHLNVVLKLHLLKHNDFQENQKQNMFFQLVHLFKPFSFNTIFLRLSKIILEIFSFISVFSKHKFIIQGNHINFKTFIQNIQNS